MYDMSTSWWKQGVVYQIYPSSFQDTDDDGIGDLQGIIKRLDHIKELGATILWISPMYDSPQHDMGYDIRDYKKVYPPYGDITDMTELLEKAHATGLRVILDLVINHTSDEHEWFKESRSSKSSSKRDWYIWKPARYDEKGKRQPPSNWASFFGGSAWEWDEHTQEYYLHLFLKEQPDINFENETARRALYADSMKFWLDLGIDGFRIDTCTLYSKDQSFPDAPITDPPARFQHPGSVVSHGPRIHEFLKEMGSIISSYGAMSVGECGDASRDEFMRYVSAERGELNMVFLFDVVEVGESKPIRFATYPHSGTIPKLSAALERTQRVILDSDAWTTTFLENHDVARSVSRWGNDTNPEMWARSAKMLALIQATLTGTLFIYQGQEIGMVNVPQDWPIDEYIDCASQNYWKEMVERYGPNSKRLEEVKASLQHLTRDNARTPMQWEAKQNGGFTSDSVRPWMRVNESTHRINVAQQLGDADSVLAFWKRMLALRETHADVFVYGEFELVDKPNKNVVAFTKTSSSQTAFVVGNFTDMTQPMPRYQPSGEMGRLLVSNTDDELEDVLQPWEGRVILYG